MVNDVSTFEYNSYFDMAKKEYNCSILKHSVNLGKGRALKTAFNYILTKYKDNVNVVTLDSDGQHKSDDIFNCLKTSIENLDNLVIGVRNFDDKSVPFRSRFGNKLTVKVFFYVV